MTTYALDALEAVRDNPFAETVVYALNRLALLNERKMAVRASRFEPVSGFGAELAAYLILVHTEEQRQKAANMYGLMKELTGLDIDGAFAQPYFRQLLEMGDAGQRAASLFAREWAPHCHPPSPHPPPAAYRGGQLRDDYAARSVARKASLLTRNSPLAVPVVFSRCTSNFIGPVASPSANVVAPSTSTPLM